MSRYVDIEPYKKEGWHLARERKEKTTHYVEGIDLDCIPTADVAEVKRGRWLDHSDEYDGGYYECSVCGESWVFIEGTPKDNNAHYCPHCGAKMDGDTE